MFRAWQWSCGVEDLLEGWRNGTGRMKRELGRSHDSYAYIHSVHFRQRELQHSVACVIERSVCGVFNMHSAARRRTDVARKLSCSTP